MRQVEQAENSIYSHCCKVKMNPFTGGTFSDGCRVNVEGKCIVP